MAKVKNQDIQTKDTIFKVEDVDDKGIVKFYAAVFGNKDRAGDIIEPGAFSKTLRENIKEIQHYKNHYNGTMCGVLMEAIEDAKGLLCTSQLILGTQVGRETYEEYKAMAAAGKSMFHSIGYWPVKWDEDQATNTTRLKEIYLREVSTLTAHPANPKALTVDVKSEIDYLNELLKADLSDVKLEELEQMKLKLQSLIDEKSRQTGTLSKNEPVKIITLDSNLFTNNLKF